MNKVYVGNLSYSTTEDGLKEENLSFSHLESTPQETL